MAASAEIGRRLMAMPPVVADPNRLWGVANRPREIPDVELPGIWHCGGGDILRLFGATLIEAQPVPGVNLPGVSRVMRDMLSLRLMTEAEHLEMRRRVEILLEYGRDALAIVPMLMNRAHHALREPFWYPALMTNKELADHLGLSNSLAQTSEDIALVSGFGGVAGGAGGKAPAAVGAAVWTAGMASLSASISANHYESRADAYRQEMNLRGVNLP